MKKFQVKFFALVAMLWFGASSVVFGSEFDKLDTFPTGKPFWNVIGSNCDVLDNASYSSWIALWKDKAGISTQNCIVSECLNSATVGGHVVINKAYVHPESSAVGKDSVYILPICGHHNSQHFDCDAMTTSTAVKAVKLKKYFNKKKPGCTPRSDTCL